MIAQMTGIEKNVRGQRQQV